MTPLLPRRATIVCAALSLAGVLFAAITEGLIVGSLRTAVAFFAILMGTVALTSLAPVFDARRPAVPAPMPAAAVPVAVPSPVVPPPASSAPGSMHALLENLYPIEDDAPAPQSRTQELRLVDMDTGELVEDRVARLEERMDTVTREVVELSEVFQDQAVLNAKAFATLRREVERITHVFPDDGEVHDGAA